MWSCIKKKSVNVAVEAIATLFGRNKTAINKRKFRNCIPHIQKLPTLTEANHHKQKFSAVHQTPSSMQGK